MISVDPSGTAERIVARIWLRVVRPGSGTAAKYSPTVFAFFDGLVRLADEPRFLDFAFFMLAIVPEW